jgi:hypothetical protein
VNIANCVRLFAFSSLHYYPYWVQIIALGTSFQIISLIIIIIIIIINIHMIIFLFPKSTSVNIKHVVQKITFFHYSHISLCCFSLAPFSSGNQVILGWENFQGSFKTHNHSFSTVFLYVMLFMLRNLFHF